MPNSSEKFIFVFDSNGVRSFNPKNGLTIGVGSDESIADVIIKKEGVSEVIGTFELSEKGYIYTNLSERMDTWINLNHLDKNVGILLKDNTHILFTDDKKDMISIFYTGDKERCNNPWKVLNQKQIKSNKIAKSMKLGECIINGDEIYIKHNNFCIYQKINSSGKVNKINYNENLSIRIKERLGSEKGKTRKLLKDINLDIEPREMVLVIGGSGAGKTTFVNAVSGYEKANAEIHYKGIDLYEDSAKVRKLVRLVPQFDTLRDKDTVYHTLKDAAMIQLPMEVVKNKEKLKAKLENILNIFGMEKERNNFVSKLSGGQRKRLSIAVEYISEPEIFFLDEPDSGLDAGSAEMVMKQVRNIVDEDKIAIVISHSPDRLRDLYDKILVIAKDSVDNCGQMAFYGSIDESLEFFGVNHLEDIVKLINNQEKADYFINKFKSGDLNG